MDSTTMDRRSFMGRIAFTAGGGIAAAVLPASLLQAGEASTRVTAACVATPRYPDSCGDWALDDMCNAYPGYTYDVRRASAHPLRVPDVADVDRMWVA